MPLRAFVAFLRPQVDQVTGSSTLDHLQRVDVEAIHVVVERETIVAVTVERRHHDPTAQWRVTCNEYHHNNRAYNINIVYIRHQLDGVFNTVVNCTDYVPRNTIVTLKNTNVCCATAYRSILNTVNRRVC